MESFSIEKKNVHKYLPHRLMIIWLKLVFDVNICNKMHTKVITKPLETKLIDWKIRFAPNVNIGEKLFSNKLYQSESSRSDEDEVVCWCYIIGIAGNGVLFILHTTTELIDFRNDFRHYLLLFSSNIANVFRWYVRPLQ